MDVHKAQGDVVLKTVPYSKQHLAVYTQYWGANGFGTAN